MGSAGEGRHDVRVRVVCGVEVACLCVSAALIPGTAALDGLQDLLLGADRSRGGPAEGAAAVRGVGSAPNRRAIAGNPDN